MSKLNNIKQVLWAKWSLRKCTSVGALPRVQGRVLVENGGKLTLGEKIRLRGTHVPVELVSLPGGELHIGDRTGINSGASICAQKSVTIGKNCAIGNFSLIMDTDFHDVEDHDKWPEGSPICIEDNVWLAARVTVLKGVTIGEGAVISAGSVVAMNIPAYSLAGGVPARVIRRLPRPEEKEAAKQEAAKADAPEPESNAA